MPDLTLDVTPRRAAWIVAGVACVVFANALVNGWSGDDVLIVQGNWRAHSVAAALEGWFRPYWPPPWEGAGLYRPFTILTYALEWGASGGRPWLFHLDNMLLHAAASALVVLVAWPWLPALGALAAGLVFAVHPVHVEAVAGVVGRADLLAAVALLSAVLSARRYRREPDERKARAWLAACTACVVVGLLSKEHAAIAAFVLAVDHALDPAHGQRPSWPVYVAVAAVTVGWLFVWRAVAGQYVGAGATTALFGLSAGERLAHMMPVHLEALRVLAWPVSLADDYSPETIPLRREWGVLAWIGLVSAVAVLGIGFSTIRRAPALAFAILVAAASYAPTSNLLFTSGVVLAERALYLAVLAPAVALGWVTVRLAAGPHRRLALAAVGLVLVTLSVRTATRTPYWKDRLLQIIEDGVEHPESYRKHRYLGDLFATRGDQARAMAEYLTAAEIAPHDPYIGDYTVRTAIALGRSRLAVREARRVHEVAPDEAATGRLLIRAFAAAGQRDSGVAAGLREAVRWPASHAVLMTYRLALDSVSAPKWRSLVVAANVDWLAGGLVQASARLDSLAPVIAQGARTPSFCDDLAVAQRLLESLRPELLRAAETAAAAAGHPCVSK